MRKEYAFAIYKQQEYAIIAYIHGKGECIGIHK